MTKPPDLPTFGELVEAIATYCHQTMGSWEYEPEFVFQHNFSEEPGYISSLLGAVGIFEPVPEAPLTDQRLAAAPDQFRATAERNRPAHVCYWTVARLLADIWGVGKPGVVIGLGIDRIDPAHVVEFNLGVSCLERLRLCEKDAAGRTRSTAVASAFHRCNVPSPPCAEVRCIKTGVTPPTSRDMLCSIWSVRRDGDVERIIEAAERATAGQSAADLQPFGFEPGELRSGDYLVRAQAASRYLTKHGP